ncbi:hypothetical protein GC175_15720 [bacterium]|nr:hypothetical protein [bacterium]
MGYVLGGVRAALVLLLVALAALVMLPVSLLPFKIGRARPALWVIVYATRVFNWIFNIRVHCDDHALLRRHEGFIFLNHLSFIEALALLSLTPSRYLAAVELHQRPVVGWMAAQVGTIFVERKDHSSRKEARRIIAKVLTRSAYPPVIVFPEGRLGLGDQVYSFRYGIFETAVEYSVSYLLCALRYSHPHIAIWKGRLGEGLVAAVWRLATFPGPLHLYLTPVKLVHPTPEDDPRVLGDEARRLIAEAVGLPADEGD